MLSLLISVVRDAALYRPNNPRREAADAEYKARRPAALERGRYRCVFCGWTSHSNECHHIDGNHANNEDSNFAVVDTLCHGYQHLGQTAAQSPYSADGMGVNTLLAAVPELTGETMNLLQRAIGVALHDEKEAKIATIISKHLLTRARPVREAFETFKPGDFAAAMCELTDEEYESRARVVKDLRLLFHADVLKHQGARFKAEFPALPVSAWQDIYQHAQTRFAR